MAGPDLRRIEEIFAAAVEQDPSRRAELIDSACGGDAALRAQVQRLMDAHDGAGGFLSEPTVAAGPGSPGPLPEGPGARIGSYKLLQLIGEGGFGSVFMAEQQTPVVRRVALKIIKLGMDTRQVIARFEAERQALAMMDHPNIAKVLDAGSTEAGRPYFVMELVRGDTITEYCDKNSLSSTDRLALFAQVCHAVQHAHQKGIIHRDIKPSNVLVTVSDGKPLPKVIDFGIAKATGGGLTERTVFTQHCALIGTPEYMSPEQAGMSGGDLDTRTDVYSLGVLLYELLTGTTPFDGVRLRSAAFAEIQRIIREEEPPKPSLRLSTLGDHLAVVAGHRRTAPGTLGRLIRGDLDWIVMMAMDKDRTRRYATANALALDVQRHLSGEPVMAAPPSPTYRVRKALTRHRRPLTAGSVLLVAGLALGIAVRAPIVVALILVSAGVGSGLVMLQMYQTQRRLRLAAQNDRLTAERNKQNAELRRRSAETALSVLQAVFNVAEPTTSGRGLDPRAFADAWARRLDAVKDLRRHPEVEASVRRSLGVLYVSVGDYGAGHRQLETSVALARQAFGDEHPETAAALAAMGNACFFKGDYRAALDLLQKGLRIRLRSFGGDHDLVAESRIGVAMVEWHQGHFGAARESVTDALRILAGSNNAGATLRRADATSMLSVIEESTGHFEQARRLLEESIDLYRSTAGPRAAPTAWCLIDYGRLLRMLGLFGQSRAALDEAREILRGMLGDAHPHIAWCLHEYGDLHFDEGKLDLAEDAYRTAHGIGMATLTRDNGFVGRQLRNLGRIAEARGNFHEAEQFFRDAAEIQERSFGADNPVCAYSRAHWASMLAARGEFAQAERLLLESHDLLLKAHGARYERTREVQSRIAGLYRAWDQSQPGQGFGAKAQAWDDRHRRHS